MILTISNIEGAPEYPDEITILDVTGDRSRLEGVYRRQGEERVWKYRDYELSFNGEYLVDSFNIRSMISIMKESSGVSLETVASVSLSQDGTTLRIISGQTLTPFISWVCNYVIMVTIANLNHIYFRLPSNHRNHLVRISFQ